MQKTHAEVACDRSALYNLKIIKLDKHTGVMWRTLKS
jgi:hypothetical protein